MASLRLVLPASTLLVLGLGWSVVAKPTKGMVQSGFVTKYVTPMANLSLDKLVGRWYMAEVMLFQSSENSTAIACLMIDFHYDDNGTLLEQTILQFEGVPAFPYHSYPVGDNGVWDATLFGVPVSSHAVVHVDDHFLGVVWCMNSNVMDCRALVLVRRVADAGREGDLEALHHRLTKATVYAAGGAFVKVIEPCLSVATAAPDLSVQNGPSTPGPE